jgi:hypothetical protein
MGVLARWLSLVAGAGDVGGEAKPHSAGIRWNPMESGGIRWNPMESDGITGSHDVGLHKYALCDRVVVTGGRDRVVTGRRDRVVTGGRDRVVTGS